MRTADEVADSILRGCNLTPEQLVHRKAHDYMPPERALRLSEMLRSQMAQVVGGFAEELARAYSTGEAKSLLKYRLPSEPIKVGFDPLGVGWQRPLTKAERSEKAHLRRVFRNRIARNLWLGLKPGIITSQYFMADMEQFAATIKEQGIPRCWHDLHRVFWRGRDPVFGGGLGGGQYIKDAAILLLPYVREDREFQWVVAEKKAA